jgi:putative ABC transport system permease protein
MKKVRALMVRLGGWFSKNKYERELREEFESHLALHIDDNMRAGMTAAEARREALLKFGGMEAAKESMRERARFLWFDTTWQDLRYALRGLRLNPGFAATALLSLALGIGASVAIFTVADNLLLRPLPYPEPSQLVMVWENKLKDHPRNVVSPGNYLEWKAQNTVFSRMAGLVDWKGVLNDGRRSEELDMQLVTAEFFPMLGAQAHRGRLFTAAEDIPHGPDVIVISYRLWQNWFGGDEGIIGRAVQINAKTQTIIGVLPPSFYFRNRSSDVWILLGLDPAENYLKTQGRWMLTAARMKPSVTLRQAQAQMNTIAQRLDAAYDLDKGWAVNVEPLRDSLVFDVRNSLLMLLAAVVLLLGVACANVANLLLARYTTRRREMAVRGALGAARWRLIRQLLTESVTLSLAGGVLGVALSRWAVSGLVALAPKELARSTHIAFDTRIVFFAIALSLVTGIVFGLAPAMVAARYDLTKALREDSASNISSGARLRAWLVAGEIAASLMLVAGAGLLFRSLVGLQAVDPGLDPSGVLTFRVSLPHGSYPKDSQRLDFFTRAVGQLGQLPGVRAASAVSYLPFNGQAAGTKIEIAGHPPAKPGAELISIIRTVLPGYFGTMRIPFKNGRDFTAADNLQNSPFRFIVNESFAKKYLAGEEPLGKRISAWMSNNNPFGEIIGVVGDVKEGSLDKDPTPTIYYVHAHLPYGAMVMVARTDTPQALADAALKMIQKIDPQQPIAEVRTMEQVVQETFARQRFSALLLAGFSLASLLLAAVGIYGVLSYSVAQRTREIGVRVALGAEPGKIVGLIVGHGARLVAAGSVAGLGGALALSGLMKSLLFGVAPRDPMTFVLAPILLILVAVIAAYLPARRAAHLSPTEALRSE